MDDARAWPPADRLRALHQVGDPPWAAFPAPEPWVPDLGGRTGLAGMWRLVADLVGAADRLGGQVPAPAGIGGRDRVGWALGATPGALDRLVDNTGSVEPVQAHDLGGLLAITGVDRAGLEHQIAAVPLSVLAARAGLDAGLIQQVAQAEAGTAAVSRSWFDGVARVLDLTGEEVAAAWLAGAVAWAPGATPECGLDVAHQALTRPGATTLWTRRLLSPNVNVPAEWVLAGPGATLTDLAALMDDLGQDEPVPVSAHWEWRIPATGLVMTPPTIQRGMLLLGHLDLQAYPSPVAGKHAGPWAVADSAVVAAADAVCGQGSALLVDRRGAVPQAAALFTLHSVVPDSVAASDKVVAGLQGGRAGAVWQSAGLATEATGHTPAR